MGYIEDIQKMYDDLYNSKYSTLLNNKNNNLATANKNEATVNTNYANMLEQFNKAKADTSNKYKEYYTGLDNQKANAKEGFYQNRNTVATQNANAKAQTRDWLASNNLLASGESVDAMLRNQSDYANSMDKVQSSETATNNQIEQTRSGYSRDEQSAISGINNNILASEREKAQKIAEILAYRQSLEQSFNSDVGGLRSEVDYNKIKDINTYNEQIRQEQVRAEQERIAYERQAEANRIEYERQLEASRIAYERQQSSSSSGGSSSITSSDKKQMTSSINDAFDSAYSNNNINDANQVLLDSAEAVNQGYMSSSDYNKLEEKFKYLKAMNEFAKSKSPTQTGGYSQGPSTKPKQYGYRNGVAGYY